MRRWKLIHYARQTTTRYLGANIEIIFISCKVCKFTPLNSARLKAMTFEKAKFHPVLKWHRPALTLWENTAMKDFEPGCNKTG
jgi:hypothetical protein